MTINQQAIVDHATEYISLFTNKFGRSPQSWFSYFKWLSANPSLGSFNESDVVLATKVLNIG